MKLRTTLLMVAAFGLVAGALTPTATADTEVPPDPGECYQVYFFYEEIGPVTVDASDSCWQVIVDHVEECENADATYEDLDDCREAIEDELNATCTDATPMSIACAIETDPCQLVTTNPCNIYCTCPVHPQAYPTPIEK